ncbi:MAG TPA: DNRLRE domain-containing protein [Acidimicrobiales bacterium]|nr:DNRLRE domain-containing protein [Acidimicrobiales bacterium]
MDNGDGTFTASFFTGPVNYRDSSGNWQPIDTRLGDSDAPGYAWRSGPNAFTAHFKEQLDSQYLRFDVGGRSYELTFDGAARRAAQAGERRVDYAAAMPGVDLRYEVTPSGVKETLVLADASVPTRYRFYLDPPARSSLRPRANPDGSWTVTDDAVGSRFTFEAPSAVDSAGGFGDGARHASMTLRAVGDRLAVDLMIDATWLHDPARNFPVLLDPTITLQPPVEDASFDAACSTCVGQTSDRLRIGMGLNEKSIWRSALQFDVAALPAGAVISDAQLKLYHDGTCLEMQECPNAHSVAAHRVTESWTPGTTSANLRYHDVAVSTFNLAASAPPQWMNWSVATTVRSWVAGTTPNYGLLLKGSSETEVRGGPSPPGRRFADSSLAPKIEVSYSVKAVDLLPPDTLRSNGAELGWSRFDTASGPFTGYEVHRSSDPAFTPSVRTLVTTLNELGVTSYRDTTAAPSRTFTYKVVVNESVSNARTVTLPEDGNATKTLQPIPSALADTVLYRKDTYPECFNTGSSSSLELRQSDYATGRGLLRFDLSDVPATATVTSATLALRQSSDWVESSTVQVRRVASEWREGTGLGECTGDGASWRDARPGVPWAVPGGDFDGSVIASRSVAYREAPTWHDFSVASAVQEWVSGSQPNHGFILSIVRPEAAGEVSLEYRSSDYTTTPTERPKLTVTYTDGSRAQSPTVAISAPSGGTVTGTSVAVSAAATDDGRVDQVDFLVDGVVVASDSTTPFSANWNSTGVGSGAHTLTARAVDNAGNSATSAGVVVSVDNSAPPTTAVTAPLGGATVSGSAVAVSADAGDDGGVSKVEFFFDDQRFAEDTSAPYAATWNTLSAELPAYDGSRVLTTKAYSTTGQVTTSAPVNVTVANTAGTKYRASFTTSAVPAAMTYDPALQTQQTHPVDVTVKNESALAWDKRYVSLVSQWKSATGTSTISTTSYPLAANLAPGASVTIRAAVPPPTITENVNQVQHRLVFDMRDTQPRPEKFFASAGNSPTVNPVIVVKALKAALGLERYYTYRGEELGAGVQQLVNVANGNALLRWTPLSSAGRGLSTVLDLTYNSLEDHSESPVGHNFSLGVSSLTRFGNPLDVHPNAGDTIAGRSNKWIRFTDGDGTTHRFNGTTHADGSTYWTEPPGVHLYLREYSTTDTTRKWALTRPDRVTFFYDVDGFPTAVEDRNGNRITFTLEQTPAADDPGGPKKRVTSVTDAGGRAYALDYFTKDEVKKAPMRGKVQRVTDHSGSALDFDYYEDGNLLRITQRGGTKADGSPLDDRAVVFTYTNSAGDAAAITDPAARANPDPRTANQSSRLYSVRDPKGKETTFTYYGPTSGTLRWRLNSVTDRAGASTTYTYDLTNRITTATAPLSRVTKYAYDVDGKVTKVTNPKNEDTTVTWSTDFHPTKVTEPTGKYREFVYNANGYPTSVWNELREQTTLTYDSILVDANDVSGKWAAGRTIPHISQLRTKTDPKGAATATPADDFQWSFGYDPRGNLTSVTDPENFATTNVVNADGTVASTTDANTHTTTFPAYDPSGQPTRITDALGRVTQLGYDPDGLVLWVQDAAHATNSGGDPRSYRRYFDYDAFHRLGRQSMPKSTSLAPGQLVWSAADYDANDNVITEIAPHFGAQYPGTGARTTAVYDAMDRRTASTGPENNETTTWGYDAAGRTIRVTTPKGEATAVDKDFATYLTYDTLDRVTQQARYDVDGAGAITRTYTTHACYDLAGDLRSVTAPNANLASVDCASTTTPFTTRLDYDAAHRRTAVTNPLGQKAAVEYDANGNVTASVDAKSARTTYTYNERNERTRVVEPLTTGLTPRNLTTRIDYDGVGNQTRIVSPRAWDASVDKVTFTQYVTSLVYDAADQLVRVDLPTSAADPAAQYLHRGYDALGRPTMLSLAVATTDPAAIPAHLKTTTSYFDPGWVATEKNPALPKVHFDYTAEGRQSTRTPESAAGSLDTAQTMRWTYFADGMLASRTDRAGHKASYGYDANNLLVTADAGTGLTRAGDEPYDIDVRYDGQDRIAKAKRKKHSETTFVATTMGYDRNGNLTAREDNRTEDASGGVTKAGRSHTFGYDAADRLSTHTDLGPTTAAGDDQRITPTYDANGRETARKIERNSTAWATKQTTDRTYTANGLLATLTTRNGAAVPATLASHTLSYEDPAGVYANGQRTADTFTLAGPDATAPCRLTACTARFTYDPRERLVRHDDGHGTVTDYALDTAGNITTETATGQPTKTYTYAGEQLRTLTTGGSTANYFYDTDGNLDCVTTATGTQSDCARATGGTVSPRLVADYSYDYLNRLAAFAAWTTDGTTTTFAKSADYGYDALDRQVSQTEIHGSSPARTTTFDYLALTGQLGTEQHKVAGATTRTKSYGYDASGGRVSLTDAPATGPAADVTYGYDPHGSVSLLVKADGTAAAAYGYTPYGTADAALTKGDISETDPVNPFRYTARRLDTGSGTLDMGARRFGPDARRFVQYDVLHDALANLGLAADPLTGNRYGLAGGNPVGFVEWGGHMAISMADHDGSFYADHGDGPTPNPSPQAAPAPPAPGASTNTHAEAQFADGFLKQVWGGLSGLGTLAVALGNTHNSRLSEADQDEARAVVGGVGQVFRDPSLLYADIEDDFRAGRTESGLGRIVADVGMLLFPLGKVGKLSKASRAAGAGARIGDDIVRSADNAFSHGYSYHPRIRARGVQDPVGHNFPYSYDDVILRSAPVGQADGSLLYRVPGSINGKDGFFELAVNPDTGTIFHRTFIGG